MYELKRIPNRCECRSVRGILENNEIRASSFVCTKANEKREKEEKKKKKTKNSEDEDSMQSFVYLLLLDASPHRLTTNTTTQTVEKTSHSMTCCIFWRETFASLRHSSVDSVPICSLHVILQQHMKEWITRVGSAFMDIVA